MAKHRRPTPARTRRLGYAVLTTAATSAGLMSLAGTASAVVPTTQSVSNAPSSAPVGKTLTFSGTLQTKQGKGVASQKVELQRTTGSGWKSVKSENTDSDGHVSIPTTLKKTSTYRLSYGGDVVFDGDKSSSQKVVAQDAMGQRIVDEAARQAGKPYAYGATGPDSFDCSGLTQYVHKQVGISLPRTADEQAGAVKSVSQSAKKPGDLIFFSDGGSVYHVGIYAGHGEIWHAPQPGDHVRKAAIWTDSYTVGRAW